MKLKDIPMPNEKAIASVACPVCGAKAAKRCHTLGSKVTMDCAHEGRKDVARRALKKQNASDADVEESIRAQFEELDPQPDESVVLVVPAGASNAQFERILAQVEKSLGLERCQEIIPC